VDVNYINPFIESIQELFSRMLGSRATRGEVVVSRQGVGKYEITAIIGLGGPVRGVVALSFPQPTALGIASRLLTRPITRLDDTVSDAVAECVNIVAGNAKARLGNGQRPIDLSLPTVVRGESYALHYPAGSLWLEIQFLSDLGPFSLSVTLAKETER
jgi:chemotaxis protein CheX